MVAPWRRAFAFLAAFAFATAAPAQAQSPAAPAPGSYPNHAVRILAPYSAGAGPAVFTKVVGDKLAQLWGQPVIVDPRPGASGFLALEAARGAPADGYTLLVVSNAHVAINPSLYRKLPYDPAKDFVPVAMFYRTPFFLIAASKGPYATVPALVAAAKAQPDTVSYGSSYVGSPSHLGSAEFEFRTGTKMIHVPYKDQSQMYVAIAAGDVGWAFSTLGSALSLVQAGRIKLVAIASKNRSKSAPDVPTLVEAGGPDMVVDSWLAVMAPRGTPADVVDRVNADVNRVLADPEVLDKMKAFGFEPAPGSPRQLGELIDSETKRFAELVKRTGATAE